MEIVVLLLTFLGVAMIGSGIRSGSVRRMVTGGTWIVSAVCLWYLAPYITAIL